MRQGQQNRRGRGRQSSGGHNSNQHNQSNINNNRKGQNPLARSYESNGPDVKIRGNPAHIAEKYTTLARDAQSSGDSVLAEAYLQYAEHYNRIIMTYREQQQQSGEGQYRPRVPGEAGEAGSDQAGEEYGDDQTAGAEGSIRGQEPQPGMFDPPHGRFADRSLDQPAREERGPRDDRGNRDDRPQRGYDDRQPRRNDGNRDGGQQREGGQRDGGRRERYGEGQQRGYNGNRDDRRERIDRNPGQDRGGGDRPNNDRSYQDRQSHSRQPQDRNPQDRNLQDRPERIATDRASFDRPSADRLQSDAGSPDTSLAPEFQASSTAAPAHEVAPVHDVVPVNVAAPAAVPREPSVPRRRAAAVPAADRFTDAQQEQPEFLRRPVRRPKREAAVPAVDAGETPSDEPGKNEP